MVIPSRTSIAIVIATILALFLAGVSSALAQGADKLVQANFTSSYIDLVPYLGAVETDRPEVSVQVPSVTPGATETMVLQATGKGPTHRWAIFTIYNPEIRPVEVVADAARQSFPGSGISRPSQRSSRVAAASSSDSTEPRRLAIPERDAFAITVPPRSSMTVALELSELGVNGLRLWQRPAFDANVLRQSLYRGLVLGMSVLAVLVITCLVVLSPQILFPLSAMFAWSAVAFIALETGLLQPVLRTLLPVTVPGEEVLSAVVEALMAAGVLFMGVTIMRTRRQMPALSAILIAAGGGCLGLAGYAVLEPVLVKQLVRPAFAAAVGTVILTAVALVSRGGVRARSSLLVWAMLGLWTAAAGYIASARPPSEMASPVLVGGLALVLVTLAFVLTYFAFSSVLNPELDAIEADRNALALASGEQVVWDYQPGDDSFHVGGQLAALLGYEPDRLHEASLQDWADLLHPNDLQVFNAVLQTASSRPGQRFDQQLRLRHADGRYRWYQLKGRSLANASETGLRLTGVLSDASQERQSQERMLSDAIYDVITGLPNYALYTDRLNRAVSRVAATPGQRLAVMIIDIDRFRVVNNRLGQEIGDSLLKSIARRLEALLPETSSLARLPGDQFALIHEMADGHQQADREELIVFVDKVRHAVSSPIRVPPNEIYLTCCMGVAEWDPQIESPLSLHQYAEVALFDAKKRGKDRVSFYRPGMHAASDGQGSLTVEDLQHALEEQRFEIVYQPIMRMADRQLAGFEALVRLRRRDGAVLEPASFVPLAERCGLIGDIGAHVLSEAARQLGIWQRMFTPAEPVFVAVNVSSAQLAGPQLLHLARTILAREELVPGTLKLELTETMVMENPELSLQVLERLKALGIGLSCDDFGTGYSSLSYLRRLPFDTLKVDRSFLLAGLEDERGSVVLDAIILLAHDLGLQVVCEGVETEAQMQHLATLECDLVQGFLIGEPIDAQQVLEALGAPSRDPAESEHGIAALWRRLTRKQPQLAPPPPPVPVEPEPEDEQLAPWSPYDFHPAPWAPRLKEAPEQEPFRLREAPEQEPPRFTQAPEEAPLQLPEPEPESQPEPALEPESPPQPEPEQVADAPSGQVTVPADIETVRRQVREALADEDEPSANQQGADTADKTEEPEVTKPAAKKPARKRRRRASKKKAVSTQPSGQTKA